MRDKNRLASVTWADVFRSGDERFQLSLVTRPGEGAGSGWLLIRSSTDFTDEEVTLAGVLLPLLVVAEHLAISFGGLGTATTYPLTPREAEILRLVAEGRTAASIGRRCGISELTVRKHLERVYRKLGRHDRLTAVERAREIGLI